MWWKHLRAPALLSSSALSGTEECGQRCRRHYSIPDGRLFFPPAKRPAAFSQGERADGVRQMPGLRRTIVLLVPEAEALGDAQVSRVVHPAQIRQHSSTAPHQLQKPSPARLIVLVASQVLGQLLMRPVMMATCTSGEPVSAWCRWYCWMNLVFSSFPRGMTYAFLSGYCAGLHVRSQDRGQDQSRPHIIPEDQDWLPVGILPNAP